MLVGMFAHVIEHDMLHNIYTCIRLPLTFKSAYVELGTMEVEHELTVTVVVATVVVTTMVVVTVVVATMYGDVCELLGVAKSK